MSKRAEFCLARIYMKWGVKPLLFSSVRHRVIQKLIKCTFHSQEFIRKVKAGLSTRKFQKKNIRLLHTGRTLVSYSHRSKCLTLTPFLKLPFSFCPLYSLHRKNCSVRSQALWTCNASSVCVSRNPTLKLSLSPSVSKKGLSHKSPSDSWTLGLMPETFISTFGRRAGSATIYRITLWNQRKVSHIKNMSIVLLEMGKATLHHVFSQNQSNCTPELMLMPNLCTGFIRLFKSFCDGDQQHR